MTTFLLDTRDARLPRTLPELLAAHERVLIIEALARSRGSRTGAARLLGIRREHLYKRVRALKIDLAEISVALGRPRGRILGRRFDGNRE